MAIASMAAAAAAIGPIRRLWSQGESLAQPSIDRRRQNGRKVQKRKTKGASSHFPSVYQRKEEDSLYLQFSDSQEVQKRSLFSRPKCPSSFLFAMALGAFAQPREKDPASFLSSCSSHIKPPFSTDRRRRRRRREEREDGEGRCVGILSPWARSEGPLCAEWHSPLLRHKVHLLFNVVTGPGRVLDSQPQDRWFGSPQILKSR